LVSVSAKPHEKTIDLGRLGSLRASYGLEYRPSVSSLIWEMKYGGKPGLGEFLARFLWLGAGDLFCRGGLESVLVPVPVHSRKKRERGYNQAEVLCRHVSDLSGIPVAARTLAKRRDTPSQTTLERDERLCNVVGSFEVGELVGVRGRRVILIDDVVTTGSTMRECAVALMEGGAKDIRACAVASSG
jgi:ComF family protein